jgi:hypothetical protein
MTIAEGMLAYVKRTTVKIPDDLDARLRQEAQRRGVTISTITREALEAFLVSGQPPARRRLLAAGAGSGGGANLAERVEQLLAEGFGESSLSPEQRRSRS